MSDIADSVHVSVTADGLLASIAASTLTLHHKQTRTAITVPNPATPSDLKELRRGLWEVTVDGQAARATKTSGVLATTHAGHSLAARATSEGLIDVTPLITVGITARSARNGDLTLHLRLTSPLKSLPEVSPIVTTAQLDALPSQWDVSQWELDGKSVRAVVTLPVEPAHNFVESILHRDFDLGLTINGERYLVPGRISGTKYRPATNALSWHWRSKKLPTKVRRLAYKIFRTVLPINKNKYFFQSYLARSISDSPRAIFEYLATNEPQANLVWSLDDINVTMSSQGRAVRAGSLAHYFHIATARYVISNTGLADGFNKRTRQIHLQTWHGSTVKRVGRDKGIADSDRKVRGAAADPKKLTGFARRVSMWDFLIAANSLSAQAFMTAWRFGGEMLRTGYPRNDALFDQQSIAKSRARIRQQLGIPDDHTVALWAPTWPDDAPRVAGRVVFQLPISLTEVTQQPKLTILAKLHYLVANQLDDSGLGASFINVSDWDDVNDLFPASDLLVSDYSGVIPDYSNTGKPIVIYAPNYDAYTQTRGLYIDLKTDGPGPVVETEAQLYETLLDRSWVDDYAEKYRAFAAIYGEYETGHATQTVLERIRNGEPPKSS